MSRNKPLEQTGKHIRESGLTDDTAENSNRINADLNNREERPGFFLKINNLLGSLITVLDHLSQSDSARPGKRDFRYGEVGGRHDQSEDR